MGRGDGTSPGSQWVPLQDYRGYLEIYRGIYICTYIYIYIGYRVWEVKLKDLGFSLYRNCIRFMSGVLSCVLAVVVKALYNFCVY